MNDTSVEIENILNQKYKNISGYDKVVMMSNMFDSAYKIVESSLPENLSAFDKKIACFKRIYSSDFKPDDMEKIIIHFKQKHSEK